MAPIDYVLLLNAAFKEYADLFVERQEVDLKLSQKEQFIRATVNMLPEDQRGIWESYLEKLAGDYMGLSQAVRAVLQESPKRFHTATEVRKALEKSGFDFANYTTNPLSSVHAALKRLKPEEAEMEKVEGVMAWRWIGEMPLKVPDVSGASPKWMETARAAMARREPSRGRLNASRFKPRW